jgi:hypothetical protein
MLAAGCKGEKVAARSGLFFSLRTLRICFVFAPPPSLCCASLCPSFLLGSHLGGQEPTVIYAGVRGEAGRSLQPHGNGRGGPPFIFSCLRPRPRPHPSRLAFCMQVPATATRPPPGRHTTLRLHLHIMSRAPWRAGNEYVGIWAAPWRARVGRGERRARQRKKRKLGRKKKTRFFTVETSLDTRAPPGAPPAPLPPFFPHPIHASLSPGPTRERAQPPIGRSPPPACISETPIALGPAARTQRDARPHRESGCP